MRDLYYTSGTYAYIYIFMYFVDKSLNRYSAYSVIFENHCGGIPSIVVGDDLK